MNALLAHGMGRTPASQLLLARRLRASGFRIHLFGYTTLRPFTVTLARLVARLRGLAGEEPFIVVGHSLGCVLLRAALPLLGPRQPLGCFFLAPPSTVPRAARFFAQNRLYRLLMGEPGQLLADDAFMTALPIPAGPVKIYAGTGGPTGRRSPFRQEPNDGILAVSETVLSPLSPPTLVPALHTFIMNSALVADDIAATVAALLLSPTDTADPAPSCPELS
jgi:pimeloyl-ACP methyl ester carboxylesterase